MTIIATDDFNGTDGTQLDVYNSDWEETQNNMVLETFGGETYVRPSDSAVITFARFTGIAFNNNQTSEVTISLKDVQSGQSIGASVRADASVNSYVAAIDYDGNAFLRSYTAGVGVHLGSSPYSLGVISDTDRVRIEADGTTISWYLNDIEQDSVTDSDWSSGAAGMYGFANTADNMGANYWEGGNIAAGGGGGLPAGSLSMMGVGV